MKINRLRSIIRESISENLKEIEDAAENAAMEAKLNAYNEAIDKVNKKIETVESLEEMQELVDPAKLNELKKHLKNLEKSKAKLEKVKAKKNKGKEVTTDAETDKEESVDEATDTMMDETYVEETYTMDKMDMKDEALNESFLKMQKLAGVITEGQYRKKVQMLNEALEIEWSELGNDFTQAIQQVFGKTVKIQDAEVRYRPSSDTGKQPEFTFGVTIPSVGDKDNYKGALLYTNFLSDGNGFVGYDNYSKDKEATAEEFDKTLIPAWKKASAFVLGNLLKKPEELNKATIGGYKYEEKDLEDLKKYVASVPNLAIKKR